MNVALACRCGRISGVARDVSPGTSNYVVCHCDDCQAFAHFLACDGVLDVHAGTPIVQLAPAQIKIETGADELQCVRLSARGLFRWHAGCCRTPIGNTVSARVPLVGVIHSFLRLDESGPSRDELFGPAALIHGRFAPGGCPSHVAPSVPVAVIVRMIARLATWWITGQGTPSPFFDTAGHPRSHPRILSAAERERLAAPTESSA